MYNYGTPNFHTHTLCTPCYAPYYSKHHNPHIQQVPLNLVSSISSGGNRLALSPNGTFLAVAQRNRVRIYDLRSPQVSMIQEFRLPIGGIVGEVTSVSFSPDSNYMAVGTGNFIMGSMIGRRYATQDWSFQDLRPATLYKYSPSGDLFGFTGLRGMELGAVPQVYIYDSNLMLRDQKKLEFLAYDVAFTSSGQFVVGGQLLWEDTLQHGIQMYDNQVQLIMKKKVRYDFSVWSLDVSDDGQTLAVGLGRSGAREYVYPTKTGGVLFGYRNSLSEAFIFPENNLVETDLHLNTGAVSSVAFNRSGNLGVGLVGGGVSIYDEGNQRVQEIPTTEPVHSIAFNSENVLAIGQKSQVDLYR